ncbi:ROK family transcriptional regulator [Amycolatopsis circi]|uniref:ROK family transcriptional regulator n=1 Tax=Amycolatopsis circi TaxID=871959 RepID=UPI000E26069D|nr:ROK family transcriptional regulator [Amycolatopsis circi]
MAGQLTSPVAMRQANRRSVLDAIWGMPDLTAAELVDRAGLTRATIYSVCDELIEAGWIVELERRRPPGEARGRPSRRFAFAHAAASVVAIDAGSYRVQASIADLNGQIRGTAERQLYGDAQSASERQALVRGAVEDALVNADVGITSVVHAVLGIPAPVSHEGTVPGDDPFWTVMHADLTGVLGEWLRSPVVVENDANLAALAERSYNPAARSRDLVALLSGYRMGAGIIAGGELVRGRAGRAGELRWLQQVEGVGSTVGASYWLIDQCRRALADGEQASCLRGLAAEGLTLASIRAAAREGDPVAKTAMAGAARRLGRTIAAMASMLDPETVVICGSAAQLASDVLPLIGEEVSRLLDGADGPAVQASKLGDEIILTGAVALALQWVRQNAAEIALKR